MEDVKRDPFVDLYYLRKNLLLYEYLYGQYPKLPVETIEDIDDFFRVLDDINEKVVEKINEAPLDEDAQELVDGYGNIWDAVECIDFERITQKHHGRSYFNEIPLDSIMDAFVEAFEKVWALDDSGSYIVEVYDWNDHSLYFETEEDMESFVNNFDVAPFTAFQVVDNAAVEMYSA